MRVEKSPLTAVATISSRCKYLFVASDDDASNIWVTIKTLSSPQYFPHQLCVESVERLRSIHLNCSDAPKNSGFNQLC